MEISFQSGHFSIGRRKCTSQIQKKKMIVLCFKQEEMSTGDITWGHIHMHLFSICLDSFIVSFCSSSPEHFVENGRECLHSENSITTLVYSLLSASLTAGWFEKKKLMETESITVPRQKYEVVKFCVLWPPGGVFCTCSALFGMPFTQNLHHVNCLSCAC